MCTSVDGFTFGPPVQKVMDGRDALLTVAMNGKSLPIAYSFLCVSWYSCKGACRRPSEYVSLDVLRLGRIHEKWTVTTSPNQYCEAERLA